MGTRRSKHHKGRKPLYKDHRHVAAHLLENARNSNFPGQYFMFRTWWQPTEHFKLDILCEANADIEQAADVFARPPSTLAHKARDLGLTLPSQWARLIAPKRPIRLRQPKAAPLNYPYITKPRDEHADLLAINAIVPKGIPDNMRADICQEIMVAILEGRTSLDALKARSDSASYFVKKFYHDNYEKGGHALSFNLIEEWESDDVAARVAMREWNWAQQHEIAAAVSAVKTHTPATQFEAAWRDQIGRAQLEYHELGQFLDLDEVEQIMNARS